MLKIIRNVKNHIYTIKIRDNLYSIVQNRHGYCYEFFDIFFTTPSNDLLEINLNNYDVLMSSNCAAGRFKDFFLRLEKKASPNNRVMQDKFLDFGHVIMFNMSNGIKNKEPWETSLIKIPDVLHPLSYEVIIPKIDELRDIEAIYKYEFHGLVGEVNKLKEKLIHYVDTGILWGEDKDFFFPNTEPFEKGKPIVYEFSDLLGI